VFQGFCFFLISVYPRKSAVIVAFPIPAMSRDYGDSGDLFPRSFLIRVHQQ
jgi:hypothetical protein